MKGNRGTDLLLLFLPPVKIFALIWVIQLFAAAGASGDDKNICVHENMSTIILETNKEEATCAVLNCLSKDGEIKSIDFYKCVSPGQCGKITNATNEANNHSVIDKLKSELNKNCSSSSINNLITFSPVATKNNSICRFISTANTTATALNQKPVLIIPPLTEGQPATLTCTAAALCSGSRPNFTWWLTAAGQKPIKISKNIMVYDMNQSHTSALNITASAEHHNKKVTCRVTVTGNIIEETETLKVNYNRKILKNGSRCEVESEVMTCVCVSEGFPLPTISWSLLKNSTKHTTITNVSDQSVTSTMIVSLKDPNIPNTQCVSIYKGNETKETIYISKGPTNSSSNTNHPYVLQLLEEILERPMPFLIVLGSGILIGMLLSAIIACLAVKCHSRKKRSRNLDEGLEMVTTETVSKRVEDGIQDQEAAAAAGDESSGQLATDFNEATKETVYANINKADAAPKETVYSDIDFSAIKEKSPADVNKEDVPETEYAEIKKGEFDERPDDGEMMEGDDEKVVMLEEDAEAEQSLLAEGALVEDVPLFSTMDDVMDEN